MELGDAANIGFRASSKSDRGLTGIDLEQEQIAMPYWQLLTSIGITGLVDVVGASLSWPVIRVWNWVAPIDQRVRVSCTIITRCAIHVAFSAGALLLRSTHNTLTSYAQSYTSFAPHPTRTVHPSLAIPIPTPRHAFAQYAIKKFLHPTSK